MSDDLSQCEAWDLRKTEDDAVYERCTSVGTRVTE